MKEYMNKYKDILCSQIERLNTVKRTIQPKEFTDSMHSLLKNSSNVLTEKHILKFRWNLMRFKNDLEKNKFGGFTHPNFKTYYKVTVIKIVQSLHKGIDQMEQTRESRNKLTCVWSSDLSSKCQDHTMGKSYPLQQTVLRKLGIQMQKKEVGPLTYNKYKN